jgi:CRP-like cAMP-binding protein
MCGAAVFAILVIYLSFNLLTVSFFLLHPLSLSLAPRALSLAAGAPPSFYPSPPSSSDPSRHRTSSLSRHARTGLRFMATGQSLLDIEETPGLYVIISGRVEVLFCGHSPHVQRGTPSPSSSSSASSSASSKATPSFLSRHRFIAPTVFSEGDCLGQIALLAGNSTEWYGQQKQGSVRHPVLKVKALSNTWLLKVSMLTYEKALADHPEVIFHFSDRMISVLPPMIRLFDFCTKWVNLKGGDDVVKQGEESQGKLYIVLFGTLLSLVNENSAAVEDADADGGGDGDKSSSHIRRDDEASSGYSQLGGGEREGYIFGRGTLIGTCCHTSIINDNCPTPRDMLACSCILVDFFNCYFVSISFLHQGTRSCSLEPPTSTQCAPFARQRCRRCLKLCWSTSLCTTRPS